jgi:hypothetical protein
MMHVLEGFPDNVVAVRAEGDITAQDYRSVLHPAIDRATTDGKARLLYELGPEFTGFEGGAFWEDAKMGFQHLTSFERIAVVTDVDWVQRSIHLFGVFIPGTVRVFENSEFETAKTWITSGQ